MATNNLLAPLLEITTIAIKYGVNCMGYILQSYNSHDSICLRINIILMEVKLKHDIENIYFKIDYNKSYDVQKILNAEVVKSIEFQSFDMPLEEAFDAFITSMYRPELIDPLIVIIKYVSQELHNGNLYKTLIGYSLYKVYSYVN